MVSRQDATELHVQNLHLLGISVLIIRILRHARGEVVDPFAFIDVVSLDVEVHEQRLISAEEPRYFGSLDPRLLS